jgi:hypothetical protein
LLFGLCVGLSGNFIVSCVLVGGAIGGFAYISYVPAICVGALLLVMLPGLIVSHYEWDASGWTALYAGFASGLGLCVLSLLVFAIYCRIFDGENMERVSYRNR